MIRNIPEQAPYFWIEPNLNRKTLLQIQNGGFNIFILIIIEGAESLSDLTEKSTTEIVHIAQVD